MTEFAVTSAGNVNQSTPAKGAKKGNNTNNTTQTKPLGATDTLDTEKNGVKLTPIMYEIKDRDTLMKIANELGLSITDLVDQLKKSGKLPEDYDPAAKHGKDISWMKKGNKIKLAYPATEQQKADYEAFCDKRTKEYYNKKAAKAREEKTAAKAQAQAEYDALPWYKKIFTERP